MSISSSLAKSPAKVMQGTAVPIANVSQGMTAAPYTDPRIAQLSDWLKSQRQGDMTEGADFAKDYFGNSNPEMKAILDAQKAAAFGTDTTQTDQARAAGLRGINSQMATGLRSLKGLQGATGVAGGAAIGQALPTLTKANQARADLESNLAIDAANRKTAALNNYESSVTGERAGQLGTIFGYAGLGNADRTGAMQYTLGQDYVNSALGALGAATGGGSGGPGGPESHLQKYQPYLDPFHKYNQQIFGKYGAFAPNNPVDKTLKPYLGTTPSDAYNQVETWW